MIIFIGGTLAVLVLELVLENVVAVGWWDGGTTTRGTTNKGTEEESKD